MNFKGLLLLTTLLIPGITLAAFTYATWNPADTGAIFTLSGGNLTATYAGGGSSGTTRSDISVSTGKCYWEVLVNSTGKATASIGISTGASSKDAFMSGTGNYGWFDGDAVQGGVFTPSGLDRTYSNVPYDAGDLLGFAWDADAGSLQAYKNNVAMGSAQPIAAGTYYAGGSTAGGALGFTVNFGNTAFTYTPPTGYEACFRTGSAATFQMWPFFIF